MALGGATLALSRLKLAAPTVERIVLRPGALVEPERVILVLDNPEIEHAAANADSQLAAAEAELVHLKVQVQRDVLKMESTAANAKSNYEQARLRAEVNEKLFQQGLITELDRKVSDITAEAATACHAIEQKRVAFSKEMVAPQIAVKEAEVARSRAQARLRHAEQSALAVRAGMHGVLQLLPVEIGAQVQPGANIARVADHSRLKAEVRVAETQVKDIQISQLAWCSRRWSERRACCWPRHWARSCPSAAR
ncbi:MAG: HlyD family secretion protein [Opitutaceae bacterium]